MSAKGGKDKESGRNKSKTRSRSTKESESSVDEDNGKTEKIEKQVKIDSMFIQPPQKDREPSIEDMISVINAFDMKLSMMASKEYIEKSLSKLVSEQFVNEKLETLKSDLGKEIKGELDKVYTQLRSVKDKLLVTDSKIEEFKNTCSDLASDVDKVKAENILIKQKNEALEEQLLERDKRIKSHEVMSNMEQYTRRNSVRIYGISDSDKAESYDKSIDLVIKLLNDKLGICITDKDIDIAHRLGKFLSDGNRPIICKFVRRATKFEVLNARRKLKGSSIVIREDLTTKNAKLLEAVSAKPEVSSVWSHDGKIIALLLNGKKVRFDLWSDVEKPLISRDEMKRLKEL